MATRIKAPKKPLILIVDDNVSELRLLGKIIKNANYDVALAQSGALAIIEAKKLMPDLILLDLLMPEIDGYEVCDSLKNDPGTENIPIIILTGVTETENIIQSFQLGAVDFVRKSDSSAEMLARINSHINIKNYTEELARKNKELIKLNKKLNQLNEEKDEFLSIAAHDLKNPISNIALIANILKSDDKIVREDIIGFAEDISDSAESMLNLIQNLLDIHALEKGDLKLNYSDVDLNNVIKNLQESYKLKSALKNISIKSHVIGDTYFIRTDAAFLRQILDNLISNSIKYSPYNSTINVRAREINSNIYVEIEDEGPGIKKEEMSKLFKKFARLSSKPTGGESSTGLGLYIVKKAVDMLKGKVWCESKVKHGAKFIVELPKNI